MRKEGLKKDGKFDSKLNNITIRATTTTTNNTAAATSAADKNMETTDNDICDVQNGVEVDPFDGIMENVENKQDDLLPKKKRKDKTTVFEVEIPSKIDDDDEEKSLQFDSRKNDTDDDDDDDDDDDVDGAVLKETGGGGGGSVGTSGKSKSKSKSKAKIEENDDDGGGGGGGGGGDEDYEVEGILEHKVVGRITKYLIRWKGYDSEGDTWQVEADLDSCPDILTKYKNNHPELLSKSAKSSTKTDVTAKKGTATGNRSKKSKSSSKKTGKNKTTALKKAVTNKAVKSTRRIGKTKPKYAETESDDDEAAAAAGDDDDYDSDKDVNFGVKNKTTKKNKKTVKPIDNVSDREDDDDAAAVDDNQNYEVADIVDDKTEKGKKFYLIRWKGYSAASDTWEPENTLSCPDIMKRYIDKKSKTKTRVTAVKNLLSSSSTPSSPKKRSAKGKAKGKGKAKTNSSSINTSTSSSSVGGGGSGGIVNTGARKTKAATKQMEEDYEVADIVDDKMENGMKMYLVRWKGYTAESDTWEPEASLSCPDLVKRYIKENTKNISKISSSNGHKKSKKGGGKKRKASALLATSTPLVKTKAAKKAKIDPEPPLDDDDESSNNSDGDDNDEAAAPAPEPDVSAAMSNEDAERDWEVERVVDMRTTKNVREYKIRWKDCKPSEDTWEPDYNLDCKQLIDQYLKGRDKTSPSASSVASSSKRAHSKKKNK